MGATIDREEGNLRVLKITGLLRKSGLMLLWQLRQINGDRQRALECL